MNISIGVDIGTTQTKAVAFNEHAKVVASAYFLNPMIQEKQGMAEQDQELIFQGVCTVIQEVTKQLPKKVTIEVIAFSSAMHSLILLDEKKQPISRLITWADNRAKEQAENLKNVH